MTLSPKTSGGGGSAEDDEEDEASTRSSGSSSSSANTVRESGLDASSTGVSEDDLPGSDGASAPSPSPTTRLDLKVLSLDRRLRRRLSCDPVVRLQLFFEYGALSEAYASAAAPSPAPKQLVFAYMYTPVPTLDAFAELGSRDYTVRECTPGGAIILKVSELACTRRREPIPKDQLPDDWPAAGGLQGPEYIWAY